MQRDETPACRPGRWIGRNAAARLADINPQAFPRIAEAAGVRTRDLPTRRREYYRPDVERLLRPEPEPEPAHT